jgi:two-component system cell cycle sensor histidine kinase/response regulator CckA
MVQHPKKKLESHRTHNHQGFLAIAKRVSASIGIEFFQMMVKYLCEALDADCMYIGEFVGGPVARVRTLAACVDSKKMEAFEFPLEGSPDPGVASGHRCIYASRVRDLFPSDHRLSDLHAEAFVGFPLQDSQGRTSGLMAAIYREPLGEEAHFVESMLATFAPRAAAELNRKQADDSLRESEERYRAFIQLNPAAMWRVEFDKPIATDRPEEQQLDRMCQLGYIAECNIAAARLIGFDKAAQAIGARLGEIGGLENLREFHRHLVQSGYRFSTMEVTLARSLLLVNHWGIVEHGLLQRIWGTALNITELGQSQAALAPRNGA